MSVISQIGGFLKSAFEEPKVKFVAIVGAVCLEVAVVVHFYKKQKRNKKKNYPKDTVILHQVPRGLRAPSPSPFALKLETWLRMADIKYENDFSLQFSSKNLFPWITYNGEDVADSQFSIEYLSKTLNKDLNKNYSEKELAIARCVLKTCEESLRWCGVLHRFIYSRDPKECGLNRWVLAFMYPRIKKRTYEQGYGRHTKEEVYAIGKADLKAINNIIGNNKFLLGNEICDTDAAVFGLLAQILYHDFGPLHLYLKESCPNLMRYFETMKQTYWLDWNANIRESITKSVD